MNSCPYVKVLFELLNNPELPINNPELSISNPELSINNPELSITNPELSIDNPQSTILNCQSIIKVIWRWFKGCPKAILRSSGSRPKVFLRSSQGHPKVIPSCPCWPLLACLILSDFVCTCVPGVVLSEIKKAIPI